MKSFKSSLEDFNQGLHPLLAALVGGLFSVGMTALFMPGGIPRADAWMIFLSAGAGIGIGHWIHQRRAERLGGDPTDLGAEGG